MIRRRVLDEAGIAYVQIPLDPNWRLPGDAHPDARAAHAIAVAIAARLLQHLGADRRVSGNGPQIGSSFSLRCESPIIPMAC